MPDSRIVAFNAEIEKIIAFLKGEYGKLQTGRANAALIEGIQVEAYGQRQQLKTVAGITVSDARTIVVQPWDPSILQSVDKALQAADLGSSPSNDGHVIRITLPPMTEERRQKMTKIVHQLAEESRISLRQQRDKLREGLKEEKDEDARYTLLEDLDKAVKTGNDKIEEAKTKKELEIMTV
jgi:ribosome recycling factor